VRILTVKQIWLLQNPYFCPKNNYQQYYVLASEFNYVKAM